jgi:tRNA-splicing ligase RtcB
MEKRITVFGELDEHAYKQIEKCTEQGQYGVLCADHHIGYSMPIGGAVAYKNYISPSGVGFDIACGNKAVMTNIMAEDINTVKVMDEIVKQIGFGLGRPNPSPIDHEVLEKISTTDFAPQREMIKKAAKQLGTVGSGNHYVDLFSDEEGRLWIGVHFGSRGFGHDTAMGFLALAEGKEFNDKPTKANQMDSPPVLLDVNMPIGQDYIQAMNLAGDYAYAGRDIVVNKVLEILGAQSLFEVHNHHNFGWKENHFGEDYWVVRKGCTPAFPDQLSFVGATMGDDSVILKGVDSGLSKKSLYSTVHGSGRIMSRTRAAGKIKWRNRKKVHVTRGEVNFKRVKEEMKAKGIVLRGGGADEAPEVYKKLDEVLKYHKDTIKVLYRLKPIGVAMAGDDIFDPYKD